MVRFMGRVDWFNVKKGYGFIHVLNNDDFKDRTLFCHQSNISPEEQETFRKLFPGEYVSFDITDKNDNKEATDVRGVNDGPLLIDNKSFNFKCFPKTRNNSVSH
uniref:CSD domain-containing protein n=1 Tax=viral metagenome TaxID=1070528 RepID=A0A6C0CXX6_9ZZZZ